MHPEPHPILGACPAISALRALLPTLIASTANLLITGEPGTGKSLLASHFPHQPLPWPPPETLTPSTYLLRDPELLTADQQLLLFRWLASKPPVRMLTLAGPGVSESALRPDLHHRLAEITVALPPLRHRPGDVELLTRALLSQLAERYDKVFDEVDTAAVRRLGAHPFPGNVRELELLLEPIVALGPGPALLESMLPPDLGAAMYLGTVNPVPPIPESYDEPPVPSPLVTAAPVTIATSPDGTLLSSSAITPFSDEIIPLADLERRAVEHALRLCGGSVEAAATRLGLTPAALRQKLARPSP